MLEVAVIADDLTGAADTGIGFALAGLPTFVAFGQKPPPGDARIVAFDTDSRSLAADAAAPPPPAPPRPPPARARARRGGPPPPPRPAGGGGARPIKKKIDSTLRG